MQHILLRPASHGRAGHKHGSEFACIAARVVFLAIRAQQRLLIMMTMKHACVAWHDQLSAFGYLSRFSLVRKAGLQLL